MTEVKAKFGKNCFGIYGIIWYNCKNVMVRSTQKIYATCWAYGDGGGVSAGYNHVQGPTSISE